MRLAPYEWSREEKVLRRHEILSGRSVPLEFREEAGQLLVTGAPPSQELENRVRRMFQLHLDLRPFHALCLKSDTHQWVARARFGRLLCGSTLWEDAVKIIATTNTTWRQTVRMVELLVGKCGRSGAFPRPQDVVRFSVDELQTDCRLGYRAKTIHALASGILDGTFDLARVSDSSQSTEELFRSYLDLPGIGPYGAAHLLAMDGRHDFIAVDSEFRRFVRERYHRGRVVSDKALLRHYARWGNWKYMAYWAELWESVADQLQLGAGEPAAI